MFKKKTQPKTLKEEVSDVTHAVGDIIRARSADAVEATAPYFEKASAAVAAGGAAAAPVLHGASKKIQSTADQIRPQFDQLNTQMRDQAGAARNRFDEQIRPEIVGRVGGAATGAAGLLASTKTPKLIEELAVRVTGDKKAKKHAIKALARAGKDFTKTADRARAKKKQSDGGGFSTVLIWILALGGLAGIAYFVWKKAQPVDDPWSTPLPSNRPADARPVGTTPASKQGESESTSITPKVSETAVPAAKAVTADTDASADPDSADAPESNVSGAAEGETPRH
ncbi:hypothetical protein GCM10022261_01180 [Brevibacterium daeguense]|uniref:Uncharacterized protein n=1 Tax=Brevibacterium daeguense TaxID=909936 RepID=A0ABP8EF32_9MICO|nr:hypothetical protein [Brevibacterium daeguense]